MSLRNGGTWLGAVSAIYLVWGFGIFFGMDRDIVSYAPLFFVSALTLPLVFPPLGRWLNLEIEWDKDMFNFFKKREYQVPEASTDKVEPKKEESKKEEPAKIFYRLGMTDNNRVAFSMGYSEITMNYEGVQTMIDQLKFFQSQLHDEDNDSV